MASWRSEIQIPAPEVHRITAVLPLMLDRARRLQVADGTLLDPWNGDGPLDLHVVDGTHPLPGTRYEGTHRAVVDEIDADGDDDLAADTDEPSDGADVWTGVVEHRWAVTVDTDDRQVAAATVIDGAGTDDEIRLVVELPRPAQPTDLHVTASVPIAPDGFMAGDIGVDGTITWGAGALGDGGDGRVATVTIGHPRFRAGVVVDVVPSGDSWTVTAQGFVSGRGLSRPLFGLMMFFVAKKMRPVLDRRFADLADLADDWDDLCDEHPDDERLADALVDRWLDHFRRV